MPKKKVTKVESSSNSTVRKVKIMGKPPVGTVTRKQATPKDAAPTAKSLAQAFVQKMSTKFKGKAQVKMASNFATPYHLRRPTGIVGLDVALGGGFHAGGGVQVFGGGSTGKTHLTFRTAGQIQKNYGANACIAIACTEIRLDKGFARSSGFCVAYSKEEINEFDNIRINQGYPPFTPEERADLSKQIGELIILTGETGDRVLDLTVELLRDLRSSCQLLIVESLGALLTPDQDKKDVGDRVYGGSSGLITTWQNKLYPLYMMDGADGTMLETTVIGINQVRAVLDSGPKGPKTRPAAGAYSWQHAQLVSLELKGGETLYGDAHHTTKTGRVIRWEIRKGKAGTRDGFKGEYNWYHIPSHDPVFWADVELLGTQWGIDTLTELVNTAKDMGIISVAGSWLSYDGVKAQGADGFADIVVNDPQLEIAIRNSCLEKAGLTMRYC